MHSQKLAASLAVLGAIAGTAATSVPSSVLAAGSMTRSYVAQPLVDVAAQPGDAAIACGADSPKGTGAPNPGGVCFPISGRGAIDITITDKAAPKVGANYIWLDGAFIQTADPSGQICGSATGLAVPDGAAYLEVLVGVTNPDSSTPPKVACGIPSPGTTGTVTATGPVGAGAARTSTAPAATRVSRSRASGAARHVAAQPQVHLAPGRVSRGPVLL
jgi:hypothetical protein